MKKLALLALLLSLGFVGCKKEGEPASTMPGTEATSGSAPADAPATDAAS